MVTDLQDLLQEFLDACVAALDTIPIASPGLGGAPERSFISPGLSADDCCPDQLTVYALGVNSAPFSPLKNSERRNEVIIQARILRCLSATAEAPSPAYQAEVAEQMNADGWALWNHLFGLVRSGALFRLCDPVLWDGLRAVSAQGGCCGWILTLRVQLDGY